MDMAEKPIRVLLVDDHAMVREGMHMLLDTQDDLEVIGEASSGREAVEMVRRHSPDIVVMDITMPGMGGIEATRTIAKMGPNTRILGLTVHENREYFFHMLSAGASGYILKGSTSTELIGAIRSVQKGGVYITPTIASQMVGEYLRYRDGVLTEGDDGLTSREVEVVQAIAQGKSNREVAEALHLSVYTVQTHRARIMRKLGLENRHQLMRYAMEKGFIRDA